MTREEWKGLIISQCEEAGTYKPYFNAVIDSLAGIMEMRDDAQKKYIASGSNSVVAHTNKGGATNIVKNPALMVVMDCNAQALAYWRDLGLTPAGLKKLSASAVEPQKDTGASLEDLLAKIT